MMLFFIRRFPDIDQIVPVVYKMVESGNRNLMLLSIDPAYDIWKNPGIIFLREKFNVRIDYVYNLYTPTFMHMFLSFLICSSYRYNLWQDRFQVLIKKINFRNFTDFAKQIVFEFFWKFFSRSIGKLKTRYFNSKWAEGFLKQLDAEVLIFDWVRSQKLIVRPLLSAARSLGIPSIAIPTGVGVWTAESCDDERASFNDKTCLFDYVISPDRNYRKVIIKTGIPAEKNYILGSARFCSEWMRKYPQIYQCQEFVSRRQDKKLLKVVYMEGGKRVLRNREELIDTFRKISNLAFVDLVVKPKPRSDKLQIPELKFIPQIVNRDVSSHSLCKWADVVIMAPSGIYLEVLWQNKVLIYPKFLFRRVMVFETMNVGWIVNSYEELEGALNTLRDNPLYRPYSDEAVERLFIETLNGGIKDRDILDGYKNFILERIKAADDS